MRHALGVTLLSVTQKSPNRRAAVTDLGFSYYHLMLLFLVTTALTSGLLNVQSLAKWQAVCESKCEFWQLPCQTYFCQYELSLH